MVHKREKSRKVIKSIQRAIDILDLYDGNHRELGTTEIAHMLDLPKSTVSGILHTLEANDYLAQNPSTRKYRLGPGLIERGGTLLSQLDLRQVSISDLERLRNWCNETVNLAVRDGGEVVYIERLLGSNTLGMNSEVGRREPIHSTALGKAILAYLPERKQREIVGLHGLEPITEKTITDVEEFLDELEMTRDCGYSLDDEENEPGGRCVGAPIFDHLSRPVAALSISVPLRRFPRERIPEFGEEVCKVGLAISRRMGYRVRP